MTTALVLQYGRIDCAFGENGIGWKGSGFHCYRCMMAVAESVRQFWIDVAAGIYAAEGYTPAERKAQQRKKAEAAGIPPTRSARAPRAPRQPVWPVSPSVYGE